MCFFLSPDSDPRVADRPILVWKWLVSAGAVLASPWQAHPYTFGETKKATMGRVRHHYLSSHEQGCVKSETIEEGLHGYYEENIAIYKTRKFESSGGINKVYPAVIPAGTKYRIGMKGEFVAEALVVYKDMEDLEAVHGKLEKL